MKVKSVIFSIIHIITLQLALVSCGEETSGERDSDYEETNYFTEGTQWSFDVYSPKEGTYKMCMWIEGKMRYDETTYFGLYTMRENLPESKERIGFIRSEGKKVYFKKSQYEDVLLVYDFGIAENQTVTVNTMADNYYSYDEPQTSMICTGVTSITSCGHRYRMMLMEPDGKSFWPRGIDPGHWIDGIGELVYLTRFGNYGHGLGIVCGDFPVLTTVEHCGITIFDSKDVAELYLPFTSITTDLLDDRMTAPPDDMYVYDAMLRGRNQGYHEWEGMIGVIGDEVYVQGLCRNFPNAWVKGIIEGETALFGSHQLIGRVCPRGLEDYAFDVWFMSGTANDAVRMKWDEETVTLTYVDPFVESGETANCTRINENNVYVASAVLPSDQFMACNDEGKPIHYHLTSSSTCEVMQGNYFGDLTVPQHALYVDKHFQKKQYTVTGIGSMAFDDSHRLKSVKLPETITYLGDGAFSYCSGLENVEIPASVTEIGHRAFCFCDKLKRVRVNAATPPTTDYSFAGLYDQVRLEVPSESIHLYREADEWKEFTDIVGVDISWPIPIW